MNRVKLSYVESLVLLLSILGGVEMGSKENCVVKNKNYKLVAPDGGWGYMICVASVVIFVSDILLNTVAA